MSDPTQDPRRHLLPADHPTVAKALDALAAFAGEDLDRAMGAILLPSWRHARELSDREYRSVLAALPAGDIPAGSWLHETQLGTRHQGAEQHDEGPAAQR